MFAVTLVLAAIGASWAVTRQQSESLSATPPENTTTISERTAPSNTKPAMSLPAEDVLGRDVPDLPRYPSSVRVEYERKVQDRLVFTTVRYLSHAKLDVIRGFYRGVFRSKDWSVALPASQSATPTPAPAPQSASPVPRSATPAPAPQPAAPARAPQPAPFPDDYEDGGDDLGDDGDGGD